MTKVKIAVSLPPEQVAAAKRAVTEGRAPSVSAYVSQALDAYEEPNGLLRYLDELDQRFGPPGPEAVAWAEEVMRAGDELKRREGRPE